MSRLAVAIKLFLKALTDQGFADRAAPLVDDRPGRGRAGKPAPATAPTLGPAVVVAPATAAAAAVSTRSDALTLLAVLQREARLVDFLKEEIAGYADAQIGAAVRDVHRDAGAALERMFALRPVVEQAEGSEVAVPAGAGGAGGADGGRFRMVGNVGGQAPARGRLQHAGWQATRVEVPTFTGSADAARVVAPAEVEV